MIDIKNKVYTRLKTAVGSLASTSSIYVRTPSSFPFVSITESDNYISNLDNSSEEKFATVMYEVNVYTNNSTPETTAREILNVIDKEMYSMNLMRLSMNQVPNLEDATIFRLTARYEGVTDGNYIYRR